MKQLKKDKNISFSFIVSKIEEFTDASEPFFFTIRKRKRFALPLSCLYDSLNGKRMINNESVADSLLMMIEDYITLVGYIDKDSVYRMGICITFDNVIDAITASKKIDAEYVIDLKTSKIITTNG